MPTEFRRHPLLLQINTCIALQELGRRIGRPATLDDLPDSSLDRIAESGFDLLWLLGVWQISPASRRVSLTNATLRRAAEQALPDLTEQDITGSPFAIRVYEVRQEWGGTAALQRLRARLTQRGLRLMLDFVPNHTGLDHPWINEHPEYYIHGTKDDLARAPLDYVCVRSRGVEIVLAHGRDPYFPGWPDTLQLDYRHPGLRAAMTEQLLRIASLCDGVRCDMAMLLLSDVFARTWSDRPSPAGGASAVSGRFWFEAIERVRREHAAFVFMAEVYWDREWELQQEGFDFTYDKKLYDRLRAGVGHEVREHLLADPEYQRRSARFLENHDEPRAAATFPVDMYRAAAVITYLVPGLRFFHEGQSEGRRVHVSMHVGRRPDEKADPSIVDFYARLLPCLCRPEVHGGQWALWLCRPAWEGNETWRNMVVMTWVLGERRLLIAVNYAASTGQCYVTVGLPNLAGKNFALCDLLGDARYERHGDGLVQNGLYLEMPPWGHHVFEMKSI
ncbi:MAG TPA: alpha-amylase family glycosyl hydrolase [Polyangiaceae bacterium]|nr:alpha-amylase family glycosyl hydrolase [Polyangiaceae bacterium]